MKKFVKIIKEGLRPLDGKKIFISRYLEHPNALTVDLVCTHKVYVEDVVPVCITYGGIMQNFVPQDDNPGEGQLWLYTIIFINRTDRER